MLISPPKCAVAAIAAAGLVFSLAACTSGEEEYDNFEACQEYGRAVAAFTSNPNDVQVAAKGAAVSMRVNAIPLADPELASAMESVANVLDGGDPDAATEQEQRDVLYVVETCAELGINFS